MPSNSDLDFKSMEILSAMYSHTASTVIYLKYGHEECIVFNSTVQLHFYAQLSNKNTSFVERRTLPIAQAKLRSSRHISDDLVTLAIMLPVQDVCHTRQSPYRCQKSKPDTCYVKRLTYSCELRAFVLLNACRCVPGPGPVNTWRGNNDRTPRPSSRLCLTETNKVTCDQHSI